MWGSVWGDWLSVDGSARRKAARIGWRNSLRYGRAGHDSSFECRMA